MIRLHRVSSIVPLVLLLAVAASGIGCQKISDMKNAAEKASSALEQAQKSTNPENAGQKMGEALTSLQKAVGGGEAVRAVDFQRLKEVLPSTAAGLEQADLRGERGSQMGFSTSQAEGTYRSSDGSKRISIKIQDLGSMRGIGMIKDRLSSLSSSSSESTRGYERSTTFEGYDGMESFERYGNGGSHGELEFLVAERFQVNVEGNDVSMETIKSAARAVDYGALEGMKEAGVGEGEGAGKRAAEMYEKFRRAEKERAQHDSSVGSGGFTAVEASELKGLLPEETAGLTQTEATSATNAVGDGITVVRAEASYGAGDRHVTVTLTDYAEAAGAAGGIPGASWMMIDIQRESDSGYEKTTEIQGYPAREKLHRGGSTLRCEVDVVVARRFLVAVDARNVAMEEVKRVLDQIGLPRLENLGRAAA